jgi:4-hydroxybenzoate polyprenyltransferase
VAAGGRFSPAWAAAWGSWATLSVVTFVIYLASGGGYPWFLWIAGPSGLLLLARWISGSSQDG